MCLPSLSELIEACGEGFEELVRFKDKNAIGAKWGAFTNPKIVSRGNTPEEAVARLWLGLNKK